MHRHKFRLVAAAQIMDGVRRQLFARAALAFDRARWPRKVRPAGSCRALHATRPSRPKCFRGRNARPLCCRSARFSCSSLRPCTRARDQQFDLVQVERLGHKIVGAAFHRFDRDIDRAVGRHHDADRGTRHFQGAIDQGHSIFAAEAQVGEKDVDLLAVEHIHRTGDIRRDIHVVIVLKQTPQAVARVLLVIDNEDGGL